MMNDLSLANAIKNKAELTGNSDIFFFLSRAVIVKHAYLHKRMGSVEQLVYSLYAYVTYVGDTVFVRRTAHLQVAQSATKAIAGCQTSRTNGINNDTKRYQDKNDCNK